jgi:hypothetical protein
MLFVHLFIQHTSYLYYGNIDMSYEIFKLQCSPPDKQKTELTRLLPLRASSYIRRTVRALYRYIELVQANAGVTNFRSYYN